MFLRWEQGAIPGEQTGWKKPCAVAEIPGSGLPFVIASLQMAQICCMLSSKCLTWILSKISLDDTDLVDLKQELEASGERHRRSPSRSLSVPNRPRPLQPPQRPPPPGEFNFLLRHVGLSWTVACHFWVTKKVTLFWNVKLLLCLLPSLF